MENQVRSFLGKHVKCKCKTPKHNRITIRGYHVSEGHRRSWFSIKKLWMLLHHNHLLKRILSLWLLVGLWVSTHRLLTSISLTIYQLEQRYPILGFHWCNDSITFLLHGWKFHSCSLYVDEKRTSQVSHGDGYLW